MELPKIDTSNLWDKTYTILKERIIRREFSPNQKLLIPELAEQLGVSRTPIRDALNRLEMDGLVTTVSKVGTFVNAIEIKDVLNIMDTRLMLEFWVAEKLAEVPKEELENELAAMEEIIQRTLIDIKTLPLKQYLQNDYNMAFHLKYMELGRNHKNTELYKNIMNYRFLAAETSLISEDMITTAANQHLAIVQSIRNGDVRHIKSVIKLHLDDSKERLINKIEKNGGII